MTSDYPSAVPSDTPSSIPSLEPSASPSDTPSDVPSLSPSGVPSDVPSETPSTKPSFRPSAAPTISSTEISSSGNDASHATTVAGFTAAGAFIILAGLVIGRRYRSESAARRSSSSFPHPNNYDEDDGVDVAIIEGPQPSDITASEPRTPRYGSDAGDKYERHRPFSPGSEAAEDAPPVSPVNRYDGPKPFSPDSRQHRAIATLIHSQAADPAVGRWTDSALQGFQPYADEVDGCASRCGSCPEDACASRCGSCPEDASTVRFGRSFADARSTQSI